MLFNALTKTIAGLFQKKDFENC